LISIIMKRLNNRTPLRQDQIKVTETFVIELTKQSN
jgi:hypothetical protein